jgi:hypothetical protein
MKVRLNFFPQNLTLQKIGACIKYRSHSVKPPFELVSNTLVAVFVYAKMDLYLHYVTIQGNEVTQS